MLTDVRMPKLGMSMKKGTIQHWLVAEGQPIEKDQPLFELHTDKVNAIVDAPASGVLGRVVVPDGGERPVGGLLAVIGEAGDTFPTVDELLGSAAAGGPPAGRSDGGAAAAGVAPAASGAAPSSAGAVHASPAARRRAKELGVDIAQVPPREPGKRVSSDDVEEFAAGAAAPNGHATTPTGAAGAPGRTIPFEGIRRVVAERLHESLQTMAQLTISREAEVAGLVARRRQLAPGFEAATGVHLTYTDLLIHEVARLLGEHGLLNSTLVDGSILVSDEVHMGFAVALADGLIVPVIRDVHRLSLGDIARERVELAAKAQAGTLTLEEIEGGTFTISNLGAFGADTFTPIINPPQCAILGTGRIVEKPAVVDGEVVVRPTMWLSLTFDHRLVDGAPAANFLQALAEHMA
jgi:pyruvate dehydrogenase E2 component (dihydrolipoamide acetyltransferase)